MSRSLGLARWDLLRPLDLLSTLWSTATTAPPVATGAAIAYRTLFTTVRRLVIGRTLTVRLNSGDITFTVTEFESRLDVRWLAVGQLNDVYVKAAGITWEDRYFEEAGIVLRNVHLRPGAPPVLVAAPVEVTLEVPARALDDLISRALPRVSGHVDDDGVARLRWSRRPNLGSLQVDTELDGSVLWLRPRVLRLGQRPWRLPSRIPPRPVQLPELPSGLTLTDLRLSPNTVHLTGRLAEWRTDVPRTRIEYILTQLAAVGRPLNFRRTSPRS